MLYDSLQLFLTNFCEPTECSNEGMEFVVKNRLLPSLLDAKTTIWIVIDLDYSTVEIRLAVDEDETKPPCQPPNDWREVKIPIVEASFKQVMHAIASMTESLDRL